MVFIKKLLVVYANLQSRIQEYIRALNVSKLFHSFLLTSIKRAEFVPRKRYLAKTFVILNRSG